jgi:SOS response regulatory protein OraA/RecX
MPSGKRKLNTGTPNFEKTCAIAKKYLRFGIRSAEELRAYLRARNISEKLIKSVALFFEQQSWINDAACAKISAENLARKGYPIGAIKQRLLDKQIREELIETALRPFEKTGDIAIARQLIQENPSHVKTSKMKLKLLSKLKRRGFDEDTIEKISADLGQPES